MVFTDTIEKVERETAECSYGINEIDMNILKTM